ncbi:MAG: ornithine cyclodeaminase family protein [Candidatus Aminicenantes bacterium]|nr:ornithine cyclodeaminase family protein [Candidatus Aminicenantes bacterium]
MTHIYQLAQIQHALQDVDLIQSIEDGFVAYSMGKVVVPPVGELLFKDPPGDVHIKYGYIIGDDFYVIKIASGFYPERGSQTSIQSGLMLLFRQKTGALEAVLLDEGFLTNIRTAAAGAVVAKYLAPKKVSCIGIIGAGVQARMQLQYLKPVVACSNVFVWGQNQKELDNYKKDMDSLGFKIQTSLNANEVAENCNLIVTVTPSKSPLIFAKHVQKGTHITAVGSDTQDKQELDSKILQDADMVVADSISQCLVRGEIFQAIKAGLLEKENLRELGHVIRDKSLQRTSEAQITVADLTGVAVQDIQISKAVYKRLRSMPSILPHR